MPLCEDCEEDPDTCEKDLAECIQEAGESAAEDEWEARRDARD
jgi:hypothetical protein